jgi:hypothetical protein
VSWPGVTVGVADLLGGHSAIDAEVVGRREPLAKVTAVLPVPVLVSPSSLHYQLSVDDEGALLTTTVTSLRTAVPVLAASGGSRYQVTVDDQGGLLTSSTADPTANLPDLRSPGDVAYRLQVDDAGALLTSAV